MRVHLIVAPYTITSTRSIHEDGALFCLYFIKFMKNLSPNQQLLAALFLSIIASFLYTSMGYAIFYVEQGTQFIAVNFLNLLQLFALPLVFSSIVLGIHSTKEIAQLPKLGKLTFAIYTFTTFIAAVVGLFVVNMLQPGKHFRKFVPDDVLQKMGGLQLTNKEAGSELHIPNNLFQLFTDNSNVLYIVLFAFAFGLALFKLLPRHRKFMILFCESMNEVLLTMLKKIIRLAPIGIFALIFSQLTDIAKDHPAAITNVLIGLSFYIGTVMFGLGLLLFGIYPLIASLTTAKSKRKIGYFEFIKTMYPTQLLAFTTASSVVALYKTDEQVSKLGVGQKIRKLVLSVGATVNMDGTVLYQVVVGVFVAQLFGYQLSWGEQLLVAGYVMLSTLGVAAMPAASLVTTSILFRHLQCMNVITGKQAATALSLVYSVDRGLDMSRTATNVTGDAAAAVGVHAYAEQHKLDN